MKELCIGVDIGGTTVKLGIFNISGELIKKWEIKTNISDNGKYLLSDVASSIREKLAEMNKDIKDCVGMGMGIPGPVRSDGYVEVCVNLGLRDIYPAKVISELLDGIPVQVANDANVAALGEAWQGGAKGCEDIVMFTLGTGVGGGVILSGKIVAGRHGLGGEVGHIHVRKDEKEHCNCGGRGCLEQIASATGIAREAKRALSASDKDSLLRKHGEKISAKNVFDAAKQGDEIALGVVDTAMDYLGTAIASVALVIDPETFVIGGGVSMAGDFLIEKLQEKYDYYTAISDNKPKLALAKLGNDAGIYGAAKMVL